MKRLEYLSRHGSIALIPLRRARWPFRFFYKLVEDEAAEPAMTVGVFKVTLIVNKAVLGPDCPTPFRVFVVDHEVWHMAAKHGFWSMMAFLFLLPLWPFVRRYQETQADRYGARSLTPAQVRNVMEKVAPKKSLWNRWLYCGTPFKRAQRALQGRV